MTATSNNQWKAKSPSTAITDYELSFESSAQVFEAGFINTDAFAALQTDNLEEFWRNRADRIADRLYNLQLVN